MDTNSAKIKVIVEKAKPSMVAQACPVCGTFGTVGYARKTCHGCDGKGYILIPAGRSEND